VCPARSPVGQDKRCGSKSLAWTGNIFVESHVVGFTLKAQPPLLGDPVEAAIRWQIFLLFAVFGTIGYSMRDLSTATMRCGRHDCALLHRAPK